MGITESRLQNASDSRQRLSEAEVESFSAGFQRLCQCAPAARYTRRVDAKLFREYVLSDFPEMPLVLADGIFRVFDVKHSGDVGLDDFILGLSVLTHGTSEDKLRFAFEVYDINENGKVTRPVLVHFADTLSNGRLDPEERWTTYTMIDDMFKSEDYQPLSDIQFDDFLYWSRKYMKSSLVSWVFALGSKMSSQAMLGCEGCESVLIDEADSDSVSSQFTGTSDTDESVLSSSPASLPEEQNGNTTRQRVSPEREAEIISKLFRRFRADQLVEGDRWYVVSLPWLRKWALYTDFDSEAVPEFEDCSDRSISRPSSRRQSLLAAASNGLRDPGQVTNGHLSVQTPTHGCQRLRADVYHKTDYMLVPATCWEQWDSWYGHDVELSGKVVDNHGFVELELYPIELTVSVYATDPVEPVESKTKDQETRRTFEENLSDEIRVQVSKVTTVKQLMDLVMNKFCGRSLPASPSAADFSDDEGDALDELNQLLRERLWCILSQHDGKDGEEAIDSQATVQLLDQLHGTMEGYNLVDGQQMVLEIRSKNGSWPLENAVGLGELPRSPSSLVAKEVAVRGGSPCSFLNRSQADTDDKRLASNSSSLDGVDRRVKGLQNLGNTCFLNASVQCLANTTLLRDYFLHGAFINDLNLEAAAGTGGRLALAYGDLVRNLFDKSKTNNVCAPRQFKHEIGQFDPRFTGFEQQDAQEFLLSLLDALAQDLNKVKDKPYVELQDSIGRADTQVAEEWWSNHLARELSVITALFTGQFKSRIECLGCGFESSRFEPFLCLSLPLPELHFQILQVVVVFADAKRKPLLCSVRVSKHGTLLDAKLALIAMRPQESQRREQPVENKEGAKASSVRDLEVDEMVFAEVYDRYIYSILPDHKMLLDLRAINHLYLYQLPETLSRVDQQLRMVVPPPPLHQPMQFHFAGNEEDAQSVPEAPTTLSWTSGSPLTPPQGSTIRPSARSSLPSPRITAKGRSSVVSAPGVGDRAKSVRATARSSIPSLSLPALKKDNPEKVAQRAQDRNRLSHLEQQDSHNRSLRAVGPVHPIDMGSRVLLLRGAKNDHSGAVIESLPNAICIVIGVRRGRAESGLALDSVLNGSETTLKRVDSQNLDEDGNPRKQADLPNKGLSPNGSSSSLLTRPKLAFQKSRSFLSTKQQKEKEDYYYTLRHVGSQIEEHMVPQDRVRLLGMNDAIHLNVVQRQWFRSLYYFLNPFREMLVGVPLVLRVVPEFTTGLELYRLIARQLGAKDEDMDEEEHALKPKKRRRKPVVRSPLQNRSWATTKQSNKLRKRWGFELRIVNQIGSTCGCCPWSSACFGCVIPDSKEPIVKHLIEADCTIAVDWGIAMSERQVSRNAKGLVALDTHASVSEQLKDESKSYSLASCLKKFSTPELLVGNNGVYCGGKCKEFTEQRKTIELWRLPSVLVIHLKRFQHNTFINRKLNNLISFPLKGLDLYDFIVQCSDEYEATKPGAPNASGAENPLMTEEMMGSVGLRHRKGIVDREGCVYDLFAVVNHAGSLGGGHYYAYAMDSETGSWYEYDDSTVSPISKDKVVTNEAYLLFFVRRDTEASDSITSLYPCEPITDEEKLQAEIERMHKLTATQLSILQRVKGATIDNCSLM